MRTIKTSDLLTIKSYRKYGLIACMTVFSFIGYAQETVVHYNIISKKKEKIGELIARRKKVGNEYFYETSSSLTVKMVLKQQIQYNAKAVYKDNILTGSESISYINQKQHSSCTITWDHNHYQIVKDSSQHHTFQHSITYSGIMLYFVEPVKAEKCFSEMNGYLNNLELLGGHSYALTDSKNGKQNTYVYKNGLLFYAHIDSPMMDIFLQRAD